jgi:pyridoxamine 5'-phosphate oxidase
MDDVKENPWSEICWYMPESREQYRLSGKLYIIKSDEKDAELKKVKTTHRLVMLSPH